MIFSTLPYLSGKPFTVIGMVVDEVFLGLGDSSATSLIKDVLG